jgi:hypothetical protein
MSTLLGDRYTFVIGSGWMLLRIRKSCHKFVEKIKPHGLRLINYSRNHAVCVIIGKQCWASQTTARFACWIIKVTHTHTHTHTRPHTKHTHTVYVTHCFSTQHWLRERTTVLRYTYIASTVPCYVRLLYKCTVCSVYSVPCTEGRWYCYPFAVTAVRFVMRCHFSTRALSVSVSHVHHQTPHTHVRVRSYS